MECLKCQELLLDGLEPNDAAAGHLAHCASCRAFREALAEADAQLTGALAGVIAPPEFEAAVRRRIQAARPPSWLPEILDFIAWSGCAAAAGAALWAVMPPAWITLASAGAAASCFAAAMWFGSEHA
jgi:hypothetical protein